MKKPIALIGAGGFAREVYWQMKDNDPESEIHYFVDEEYLVDNPNVLPMSLLQPRNFEVYICVGDPNLRRRIAESLPDTTNYGTFIHKSVQIFDKNTVSIGRGSIICAGTIITTNVRIGIHCHVNLSTTIGHDTKIGNYVTTAPQVAISGNVKIKDNVYLGTNSAIREKIEVCEMTTIGMGAALIKSVKRVRETLVGVPAKVLK